MAQRTISPATLIAMQADRDAGMLIRQIAKKYGWGRHIVGERTTGPSRRLITPEVSSAMQADRDAGLSTAAIAEKHGWSCSSVLRVAEGAAARSMNRPVARAIQADRDAGMLLADLSEKYGWSEATIIRRTTGPRFRHRRDLSRYRRIVAANASPEADRQAIAARFGLANRNVLSATVSKGRRFLAEAGRPSA